MKFNVTLRHDFNEYKPHGEGKKWNQKIRIFGMYIRLIIRSNKKSSSKQMK